MKIILVLLAKLNGTKSKELVLSVVQTKYGVILIKNVFAQLKNLLS